MIHFIGPGGAGKTTIGSALAQRLALRFVDLDAEFAARYGNISVYLDGHTYEAYAERNVGLYSDLVGGPNQPDIVALSSGFMTYPDDIHPAYLAWRQRIASSPLTFVLLPSLDVEVCVAETVRRQLGRPFARSAEREEQVIRERFPIYLGQPARKVETMQPLDTVATELVTALAAQRSVAPVAPKGGAPVNTRVVRHSGIHLPVKPEAENETVHRFPARNQAAGHASAGMSDLRDAFAARRDAQA